MAHDTCTGSVIFNDPESVLKTILGAEAGIEGNANYGGLTQATMGLLYIGRS